MLPLLLRVESAVRAAAPDVLKRVATRIGSSPAADAVLNTVKNNIGLLAYAGYELFGASDPDVQKALNDPLASKAKELLISTLDFTAQVKPGDIESYDEEFALIEDASRQLGGMANFLALRNALRLDDSIIREHQRIARMGYTR